MKAGELMRFDWVRLVDDNTPRQVDWIRSGEVGLFWSKTVTPPYLEPIPLTPEILEKNGIKWLSTEPSGRHTYCCIKPVIHCTYFPNSGWLVCVGASGSIKVRFVEISKVQHVHELQHALRLCGIEKEIIL